MKIYTEFIIFYEDCPMPPETSFCPFIWEKEDFDSDGDFYYNNINQRWTLLELSTEDTEKQTTALEVRVFRENRLYDVAIETLELERFLRLRKTGYFNDIPAINTIQTPAIASLSFETHQTAHYQAFLETIHVFLVYTKGYLVNFSNYTAADFKAEFLDS